MRRRVRDMNVELGFCLIRPGVHSLPGVGFTSTTSTRYDFDWTEAVNLPLLSCDNGICGLDNKSLGESCDHGI